METNDGSSTGGLASRDLNRDDEAKVSMQAWTEGGMEKKYQQLNQQLSDVGELDDSKPPHIPKPIDDSSGSVRLQHITCTASNQPACMASGSIRMLSEYSESLADRLQSKRNPKEHGRWRSKSEGYSCGSDDESSDDCESDSKDDSEGESADESEDNDG